MGSGNAKSAQILYYYVFQKYIKKYLTSEYSTYRENTKLKFGYLIHTQWIKEWKRRINYNTMKSNILDHLNIESTVLNENQENLINYYLEKNNIDIDENLSFEILNKSDYILLNERIISEKFLENFVDAKTFNEFNLNKNVIAEEVKYIFKNKMLILFFQKYNTIKLLLYSVRLDNIEYKLINITLSFKYLNEYLLFLNDFEKNSSDNILVYLYGIGIFGHPKIDVYNEQARGSIYQTYQLINENYKDLTFSRNLQKSKSSKSRSPSPMKIRSNINNINNISNNIVFNNFRKDNSENYSNDNINNSEDELNIKISQLENLLSQERKKNKELIIKISNLENNFKSKNSQEYILNQRIKELERELISLKEKIKEENNSFELTPGEKLLAITFISSFKKINRPIACKNTNVFVRIEEKLYESYPDLKNYDNYFWVNGKKIKRFLTLEENNINDGDRIMLSQN